MDHANMRASRRCKARASLTASTAWKNTALAATKGSRFGAILACALDVDRKAIPRFVGKASITSDGFVMCDFVDSSGHGHYGAFVGAVSDLDSNVKWLAEHLSLNSADHAALESTVRQWIGTDWRHVVTSRRGG